MDIFPYYQCEQAHPATLYHALRNLNKEAESFSGKAELLWTLVRRQLLLEDEQQKISGW